MPTISLCMIVRNEETCLERCLQSVHGLVDEIIIVDTGSKDRTQEIAERFTKNIFHFQWCDDFTAARNVSLKHATGDWILFIDADEIIAQEDHVRIKELVVKEDTQAYFLHQKEYTNNTTLTGFCYNKTKESPDSFSKGYIGYLIVENAIRLFKNRKDIRFSWKIHESVALSLEKQGIIPQDSGIFIHHYKQEKGDAVQQEKVATYLKIGEEQVKETPNNPKPWYELGLIYYALERYHDANEAFKRVIAINPNGVRAYHKLARSLTKIKEYDKALTVYKKYLARNNKNSDIYGELGLLFIKQQKYDQAIDSLIASLDINPANILARHNLVLLYLQLGKKEEATKLLEYGRTQFPNPYSFNISGIMAVQEKNYAAAKEYFLRGIALAPQSPHEDTVSLYINLIRLYILEQNKQEGILYLTRLKEFYKGDVSGLEKNLST